LNALAALPLSRYRAPMASAELSRRVEKVVGYRPCFTAL
jgi:hypothetical protein